MKVGFVGTPRGLTEAQRRELRTLLEISRATELHHGDCIGADGQAAAIASELGLRIVSHPSPRAPRAPCENDETRSVRPHAQRSEDIVLSTHLLIAAPKGPETRRSVVWRTVRVACNARGPRPHLIIWPDGSVSCGPRDTLGCYLIRDEAILGLCERAKPLDATADTDFVHSCS